MKRQVFLALSFCLALNVFSQSDSAAFVHGPWLSERVDGLVLRRCQFKHESLFASNQQILVDDYQFGTLATWMGETLRHFTQICVVTMVCSTALPIMVVSTTKANAQYRMQF